MKSDHYSLIFGLFTKAFWGFWIFLRCYTGHYVMDEHKNFASRPKRADSLDGFVSDGRQLGVPLPKSYSPNKAAPTPSLGNYLSRTDGFHPLRSGPRPLGATPETDEA